MPGFGPGFFYDLFGVTLTVGGLFVAREYGASLMGNMLVAWYARDAAQSVARRAIILGLTVYDAVGFAFALVATISGVLNPLGWLAVVIYLFFTVGFGYFLVVRPQNARPLQAA